MKFKVNKIIEATPMSRHKFENTTNEIVTNVLFSDYGYVVNGKWFPAEILEDQAEPYNNDSEIANYYIRELEQIIEWASTGHIKKPAVLLKRINKLQKLLQNE